eukprot:Nitzschia sp. Nitz4//scaffold108_size72880//23818//24489//NITZ4_005811-RA/size72880-snap-gene-0.48-mRNA-1//-1//CDS//3329532657//8263//frame0
METLMNVIRFHDYCLCLKYFKGAVKSTPDCPAALDVAATPDFQCQHVSLDISQGSNFTYSRPVYLSHASELASLDESTVSAVMVLNMALACQHMSQTSTEKSQLLAKARQLYALVVKLTCVEHTRVLSSLGVELRLAAMNNFVLLSLLLGEPEMARKASESVQSSILMLQPQHIFSGTEWDELVANMFAWYGSPEEPLKAIIAPAA